MVFDEFVTSVTREEIIPKVADTILNSNIITLRVMSNPKEWSGKVLQVPFKYQKSASGGSFQGYDVFSTTRVNTRNFMSFYVKGVYQSVVLSNMEKGVNNTKAGVLSLVETEMNSSMQDMMDTLGTQVYGDGTGNSSKDLTGLGAAVDDGTSVSTYGGLSRSTYTTLAANKTTTVGNLTLSRMATMYDSCTVGSDKPTIIVTTKTVWSYYEQLLQPTVRANYDANGFAQVTKKGVVRERGALQGDVGFDALWFRGTPIVKDEKCTSGYMYFLNENYLEFYSLPHPDAEKAAMGGNQPEGFYTKDSPEMPVISWTGWKRPVNQDAVIGQLIIYGDLINRNPRRSGVLQGITGV